MRSGNHRLEVATDISILSKAGNFVCVNNTNRDASKALPAIRPSVRRNFVIGESASVSREGETSALLIFRTLARCAKLAVWMSAFRGKADGEIPDYVLGDS